MDKMRRPEPSKSAAKPVSQLDAALAVYARNPEVAATAAALSHALGHRQPPFHLQMSALKPQAPKARPALQQLQKMLLPRPPAPAPAPAAVLSPPPLKKHPMPWPSVPQASMPSPPQPKKLQVRRPSPPKSPVLELAPPQLQVSSPVLELVPPQLQMSSPVPAIAAPKLQAKPATPLGLKTDPPMTQLLALPESKDGTPTRKKNCNCRNSKCLKMYCECFASGAYCNGCNCTNCFNDLDHEAARRDAINAILERNPDAFLPKIGNSPHGTQNSEDEARQVPVTGKHTKGCHCKKSACLKKYCECFQAKVLCSDNCRCMDCKNYESSEERKALLPRGPQSSIDMQQVTNSALMNGPSTLFYQTTSKKRKFVDLSMATSGRDMFISSNGLPQVLASPSCTSFPVAHPKGPAIMGPCKVTYGPLLAGIVQTEDVKDLCKILVLASREAAKTFPDPKTEENTKVKKEDQGEGPLASTNHDRSVQKQPDQQASSLGNCSNGVLTDEGSRVRPGSDSSDGQKDDNRPMSPGTLALMCDEQDAVFLTSRSSATASTATAKENLSEIFAEQEKRILMEFRDCLRKLVTHGRLKEKHSLMAVKCDHSAHEETTNHSNDRPP